MAGVFKLEKPFRFANNVPTPDIIVENRRQ